MTQSPGGSPETRFSIEIAPDVEGGVYANFVSIWHDNDGFTLDFAAVTGQPRPKQDSGDGHVYLSVPARIVSRVHIPPSQVFEIMKALEQQLSAWERERPAPKPATGDET